MQQLTKKDSRNMASLIFNAPSDVLSSLEEDDIYSLNAHKKYFFSAEMSFFLFFWIVNNCLQKGGCDKKFALDLENELAHLIAKKLKGKANDYKVIIRSRFEAYRDLKSSSLEDRAKEREGIFLIFFRSDIELGGFSSVVPEINTYKPSNLVHGSLYNMCLKEMLKRQDIAKFL